MRFYVVVDLAIGPQISQRGESLLAEGFNGSVDISSHQSSSSSQHGNVQLSNFVCRSGVLVLWCWEVLN